MRCSLAEGERYPSLSVEVRELAQGDPEAQQFPNIPPGLINAYQKAERELAKAERDILLHVRQTEQHRALAPYVDRRRDRDQDRLRWSLGKDHIDRWLDRLDDEAFGPPVSDHGEG